MKLIPNENWGDEVYYGEMPDEIIDMVGELYDMSDEDWEELMADTKRIYSDKD